jgi:hypothetical protein
VAVIFYRLININLSIRSRIAFELPARGVSEKNEKKYNALVEKMTNMEKRLLKSSNLRSCLASASRPSSDQEVLHEMVQKLSKSVRSITEGYVSLIEICDEDEAVHRKLYCYSQLVPLLPL